MYKSSRSSQWHFINNNNRINDNPHQLVSKEDFSSESEAELSICLSLLPQLPRLAQISIIRTKLKETYITYIYIWARGYIHVLVVTWAERICLILYVCLT